LVRIEQLSAEYGLLDLALRVSKHPHKREDFIMPDQQMI
jgi:hypothetical protein